MTDPLKAESDDTEYRIIWTPEGMNAYRFEPVIPPAGGDRDG